MSESKVPLLEHFRRLNDFGGREVRISFWPYAALVFGISQVLAMIAMLPFMAGMFSSMRTIEEMSRQQSSANGQIEMPVPPEEIFPDFGSMMVGMCIAMAITVYLYAAAVARRLHDTGRSGWWGLMPVPFIAYSTVMMAQLFGNFGVREAPDLTIFFSVFLSNLLYMLALVALVVLLALPSNPEENRYGPSNS